MERVGSIAAAFLTRSPAAGSLGSGVCSVLTISGLLIRSRTDSGVQTETVNIDSSYQDTPRIYASYWWNAGRYYSWR